MAKTEIPGIYKEGEGVLINRDNDSLAKYRRKRELTYLRERQINMMEQKIDRLSNDMEEIKDFLRQLMAK